MAGEGGDPHHKLTGAGGATSPGADFGVPFAGYGVSFWLLYGPGAFGAMATQSLAAPAGGTSTTTDSSAATTVSSGAGAGGFVINISYDSSANSAPSGFKTSVQAAVAFFEAHITTSMTITINVGYGEVNGTPLGSSTLGESQSVGILTSYSSLYAALRTQAQASGASSDLISAFNSLPTTDPTNGGSFYVSRAEAEALSLKGFTNTAVGSIGINGSLPLAYGSTNQAVSGEYDAVGVIEHEISEVLGRTGSLGTYAGSNTYTLLDLFRYSSSGVPDLTPGPGYFSIDGGTTNLGTFNDPTKGGDAGDWGTTTPDSFNAISYSGVANIVTAKDLTEMNVLGYTLSNACYAAGTRIRTTRGDVPVEALGVRDRIVTRFAGSAAVRWIGHRRIDCRRHPDPASIQPVRIAPDAFAPGQPARELLLSPDHAVELDGALVPIRLLINGGSIAQDLACAQVHYFHVELDCHDILFAEGLPAESYLDTGNRGMFENAGLPLLLHPRPDEAKAQAMREAGSCLPLLSDPARTEPLWRHLADRSAALGFVVPDVETTEDPALRVEIGTRRIAPVACAEGAFVFVIPPSVGPARLLSRVAIPAERQPWRGDRRRLGVMVQRLTMRRGAALTDVALDDPRLRNGWWDAESDGATIWRWTDGAASLPLSNEAAVLEVRTGDRLAYPLASSAPPLRRRA